MAAFFMSRGILICETTILRRQYYNSMYTLHMHFASLNYMTVNFLQWHFDARKLHHQRSIPIPRMPPAAPTHLYYKSPLPSDTHNLQILYTSPSFLEILTVLTMTDRQN